MLQEFAFITRSDPNLANDRSLVRHHLVIGAVRSLSTADVPAQVVSHVRACSSPSPDRKLAALVSEQM
jgi:hypothetical protein